MAEKKETVAVPTRGLGDPFALLRQMTSELDRVFDDWPVFRRPGFGPISTAAASWSPRIDIMKKDNQLVTRVDLPGMKKEDVSVEVADGYLTLSGERKREFEDTKDKCYRSEREYGSFYRTVPLPEGVKAGDVRAVFSGGVLEVSVPLPAQPEARVTKVKIDEPGKAPKN